LKFTLSNSCIYSVILEECLETSRIVNQLYGANWMVLSPLLWTTLHPSDDNSE
jgi:hypothetical protein